jgi:hypothetical protein
MGLFTPPQFLKPSQWLVAIPLVREEIWALSLKSGVDSAYGLVDWSKLLLSIMKREEQLQELVRSSKEIQKEELLYPIKVPSRMFGRLEQLLIIAEDKVVPLNEEQLRQVRANANHLI